MTDLELAYFAGLFDGEGCIQIAHNKPQHNKRTEQHTLCCTVAMTDQEAVESFKVFGGGIHQKTKFLNNPKWHQQWVWTLSSNKAIEFLEIIYPFLKIKAEQAKCGIEFQKFRTGGLYYGKQFGRGREPITKEELEKREWYRQELRRLKDSKFPERSWQIKAKEINPQ